MNIGYSDKTDLLSIRLDEGKQQVTNKRVSDAAVIDSRDNDRIVGIAILDASKHVNLATLFPVKYHMVSR